MGDERLPMIGSYCLCNAAAVCVHEIDHAEDRVLASINGEKPQWYSMTEKPLSEITGDEKDDDTWELGFVLGSFFVPFSEVMRV